MNQILKSKFNAWGFFIVACVWVLIMICSFMFSILDINAGVLSPIIRMLTVGTGMVMTFFFFSISRSEPGLAAIGLVLGTIGAMVQTFPMQSGLSEIMGFIIGISYIFFAFAILKQESKTASWLGWAMILSGIIKLSSIGAVTNMMDGEIGNIMVFLTITVLFEILVALAAIYYIIVEGNLFEGNTTPKTINAPENLN
ncbi:MAG TPA: hypothetical protein PL190_04215 [Caldisericia bacterium]|nr:MAG: hypothetical protein BWX90_01406 [bacterium ADurb.Bin132]HNW31648.1 hypothetical protein [Caldisericia bacterium]HNY60926.1 hypothetical protein [Caldisericia bacterium]HOC78858.1 hypothetical protein [Caldisericia bacterium]HOG69645.1 hypothetical protein [Caldisericia bacterium]